MKIVRGVEYRRLAEIADELNVPVSKLRTLVARLHIQPRRFADDQRMLYYGPREIERIKSELGLPALSESQSPRWHAPHA